MNKLTFKLVFLTLAIFYIPAQVAASVESDFNLGIEFFQAGDYSAAVDQFESAQKQGMSSVSLHFNLASSYYKLGDYKSAKKYYRIVAKSVQMKDLAEYNLGLIALKENDTALARKYFNTIVSQGEEKKLKVLSRKKLKQIKEKDDRLMIYLSSNVGYDDNITAAPDNTTLGVSDSFYDLYFSIDYLLSGKRKAGWAVGASYFQIDFSDSDSSDESQYSAGLKREQNLSAWDSTLGVNLNKYNFGGEDYQSAVRLDVKGKKSLSKYSRLYLRYRYDDISSEQASYNYLEGWRQRARVEYRHYGKKDSKQVYYELELNDRSDLITSTYAYDYSPTRHTVRAKYTYLYSKKWRFSTDLSYRFSDFPASTSFDRDDDQWRLSLSSDYRFDKTFKLTGKLQFTDNASSVDRYNYDKTSLRVGISKLF